MDDQCVSLPDRRRLLVGAAAGVLGLSRFVASPARAADGKPEMDANLPVRGPRPGYTPEIGTKV